GVAEDSGIGSTPNWEIRSEESEIDAAELSSQMSLTLLAPSTPKVQSVSDDEEGHRALGDLEQTDRFWQIHDRYILASIPDGLLVVDQHVAHERIRFEEVIDALADEAGAGQQLLMPLTVDVNPVEMEVFRSSQGHFRHLGFEVREFGPTNLIVEAIPPELRNWSEGDLFFQILSDLIDELDVRSEDREAMAATMACHTSIRAGTRLDRQEMATLIHRLLDAREPFVCPHGRPILVKLDLGELDRLFGRT
ncbi:uncharacterized protein METZ01_LOCUS380349, partial [marine metagenome]